MKWVTFLGFRGGVLLAALCLSCSGGTGAAGTSTGGSGGGAGTAGAKGPGGAGGAAAGISGESGSATGGARGTGGVTGSGSASGAGGAASAGGVGGTGVFLDGGSDATAGARDGSSNEAASTGGGLEGCDKIIFDGETTHFTDGWVVPAPSKVTETAASAHSGATGMFIELFWTPAYNPNWGGWGWKFPNVDASNSKTLSFWMRTVAGNQPWLYFCINGDSPYCTSADKWGIPAITPTWQKVVVPLSTFKGLDTSKIFSFKLDTHALMAEKQLSLQYYLDDICFGK